MQFSRRNTICWTKVDIYVRTRITSISSEAQKKEHGMDKRTKLLIVKLKGNHISQIALRTDGQSEL